MTSVGTKWFSGRALRLHATTFFVVGACLVLGWWQLLRALSGNTLSWAYTFEWPFFAGYAVYMWWKLLHDDPAGRSLRSRMLPGQAGRSLSSVVEQKSSQVPPPASTPAATATAPAASAAPTTPTSTAKPTPKMSARQLRKEQQFKADEVKLAQYNEYLAELSANDRASDRAEERADETTDERSDDRSRQH